MTVVSVIMPNVRHNSNESFKISSDTICIYVCNDNKLMYFQYWFDVPKNTENPINSMSLSPLKNTLFNAFY